MSETRSIQRLYEDNHLLVVVKPVGMLTQSDHTGDPDLLTALKADVKVRHKKPGDVFLGLVHRLDRPVGGVMVFARTSKGAARLSEQIRNRTFEKIYRARVQGQPPKTTDTLEHYLVKDERNNRVSVVAPNAPGAKQALLEYQCLAHDDATNTSLLEVNLHTGRPHQIRVQLAAIGCPLVGDTKYGGGRESGVDMALWSYRLRFKHPTRDEWLAFEAPPPW